MSDMPHFHSANRGHGRMGTARSSGFSLIEIMVSLAIGLVVIGAVFANYLNNSNGSRQAAALAQVTQDASLALGILRNYVTMAGYSRPNGVTTSGTTTKMTRLFAGDFIFGCAEGFTDSTKTNTDFSTLACNPASGAGSTPQPEVLAVRYEADADSTPTVTGTVPADCAGNGLPLSGTPPSTFYVADNRFTVTPAVAATATQAATPPALACMGNGTAAATNSFLPIVENIEEMHIWYGVATTAASTDVARYLTAAQVPAGDWSRVVSVTAPSRPLLS
jgi:type IV pilus assembly protein PilW